MISVSVARGDLNPERATERALVCLVVEASFEKVRFAGKIHFSNIRQAIDAAQPSSFFIDPKVTDLDRRFWMRPAQFWAEIDEDAIRRLLCDVLAFLGSDVIEEAETKWLCNHPANRALAARVMAGLVAGL